MYEIEIFVLLFPNLGRIGLWILTKSWKSWLFALALAATHSVLPVQSPNSLLQSNQRCCFQCRCRNHLNRSSRPRVRSRNPQNSQNSQSPTSHRGLKIKSWTCKHYSNRHFEVLIIQRRRLDKAKSYVTQSSYPFPNSSVIASWNFIH